MADAKIIGLFIVVCFFLDWLEFLGFLVILEFLDNLAREYTAFLVHS